ncbi:AraC family transcriptional regulator [Pontibacterium sp.]|uniref:AraC family transcriptional regulator n=1 Tax=Pontibacterium sp. TaxID=2036026 RepID=UPI0035143F63
MHRDPTTRASWALAIARALEASGYDPKSIFAEAGLDLSQATDPEMRYPVDKMTIVWQQAVEKTGNACFGLDVPQFTHPTTFNALGFALMASESLKEALERIVRFSRTVTDAADVRLEAERDSYKLTLESVSATRISAYESVDGFAATIIYILRQLCQEDIKPQEVTLIRPEPDGAKRFSEFFQAPVEFSAAENSIRFSKEQMEAKLPTANSELAQMNDRAMTEYLSRFDKEDIVAQVRAILLDQLSAGTASQENVASSLNMSQRSLQRRLKEVETCYADVLDQIREDLACQYLKQSKIPLISITYLLGFSDPSNFNRAFKRWKGVSPSQYRKANTAAE